MKTSPPIFQVIELDDRDRYALSEVNESASPDPITEAMLAQLRQEGETTDDGNLIIPPSAVPHLDADPGDEVEYIEYMEALMAGAADEMEEMVDIGEELSEAIEEMTEEIADAFGPLGSDQGNSGSIGDVPNVSLNDMTPGTGSGVGSSEADATDSGPTAHCPGCETEVDPIGLEGYLNGRGSAVCPKCGHTIASQPGSDS